VNKMIVLPSATRLRVIASPQLSSRGLVRALRLLGRPLELSGSGVNLKLLYQRNFYGGASQKKLHTVNDYLPLNSVLTSINVEMLVSNTTPSRYNLK